MSAGAICLAPRELARRSSGGIDVALYWNPDDDSTSIAVWHPASEQTLAFAVARERALDAFYHPFAYVPIAQEDASPALDAGGER